MSVSTVGSLVLRTLLRARVAILTIAITYLIAVIIGILMVHTGNEWALSYRDNAVARAQTSPIVTALREGHRWRAALLDFGSNLFAAGANTLGGLAVIIPYPVAAYRGWVGGIVSVDGAHASRLTNPGQAAYYLLTLVLQLIPYSLAGGAGVNLGIAYFRQRAFYQGERWYGLPKAAIRDVLRIYLLLVPLFLVASLWEFLAR